MARILVIDDSPTVIHFVRGALSGRGHQVDVLEHFVDLATHINKTTPDVVLLDLEMPGLHGEQVGQFIREFETKFGKRRISVVIFSSRPRPELEAVAEAVGAAAVIEKGASPDQLRTTLELVLAERAPTDPSVAAKGERTEGR